MTANSPDPGYSGSWSTHGGNINFSNATSPTSNTTINNGDVAHARWTVTNNSGPNTITLIDPDKDGVLKMVPPLLQMVGQQLILFKYLEYG